MEKEKNMDMLFFKYIIFFNQNNIAYQNILRVISGWVLSSTF